MVGQAMKSPGLVGVAFLELGTAGVAEIESRIAC